LLATANQLLSSTDETKSNLYSNTYEYDQQAVDIINQSLNTLIASWDACKVATTTTSLTTAAPTTTTTAGPTTTRELSLFSLIFKIKK
jgi:hypothetical protein